MDPFITNMFTRWGDSTAGVMTKEFFRSKLMNSVLRGIDLDPTLKHVPEPQLIRVIFQKLKAQNTFLIYPEGGRRWAGRPQRWIESTAKIFARSGVPIYPIILHGSYVGWPRWATYPRPAKIKVEVLDPIIFENKKTPADEALRRLKEPIDFDENIVADEHKPKWAYKPADGIHRLVYRDPVSGESGGVFTPDGTYVVNKAGTFSYKMLPDSTMLDEKTGDIFTSAQLYDQVLALPIESNKEGIIVQNHVELSVENEFPKLEKKGLVHATLREDSIQIESNSYSRTLPLEEVPYLGIERNSKLQLFLRDETMLQLMFTGAGSALQWENTINTLKERQNGSAT